MHNFGKNESELFSLKGWTTRISLKCFAKFDFCAHVIFAAKVRHAERQRMQIDDESPVGQALAGNGTATSSKQGGRFDLRKLPWRWSA